MINKNFIAIFSLFLGTVLASIASILTTIIIARNSSIEVFGNYSALLATITTFAPLSGFGIGQYWLKVFGQHSYYGSLWINDSIKFIMISTFIVFSFLNIWFYFVSETQYIFLVSILLSFIVLKSVSIEIVNTVLQINSKYVFLSLWNFLQASIFFFLIFCFVYIFYLPLDELKIVYIQLVTILMSLIVCFYVLIKFINKQKNLIDDSKAKEIKEKYNISIYNIFKESFPFGISVLFYLIYYQLGIVFVRNLEGPEESAYYVVAFTFLTAALLLPGIVYQNFLLPKLHMWAYHDKDKFLKSYNYGNYIMLVLGILAFLFLWFFASYFVNLFFGQKYCDSVRLIQLMAINIPIVYLASSAGSLLVTQEYMKIKAFYIGISAMLSLILSVPMIKTFGTEGAIYTNIICNSFILCIYFYKVKKDIIKKIHENKNNI